MASLHLDEENTREKLNQVIQDYRKNRERLINIQTTTKEEFEQIATILQPTTAELLECIDVDNLIKIGNDLGVSETNHENSGKSEVLFNRFSYEKQLDSAKVEIGNPAIAIVGQVKAGKSTFINVLLKNTVVCQAFEKCTARLTRLTYSPKNFIEVIDVNGVVIKRKSLSNSTIPRKYLQLKDKDRNDPIETGKQIRAGIKSKLLKYGIDIIDSPGLSENKILTNLSKNMIKSILPIMIYVIDGRVTLKQTDISDLLELKNSVPDLQIIYFITKLDTDDDLESDYSSRIELAKSKMDITFQKLQYNNFIPKSFEHWSDCPYFHGASLYAYMDYFKKKNPETLFHFKLFCKFEANLLNVLLENFKTKIYDASNKMINFQMDVMTKIIKRAEILSDVSRDYLNQICSIQKAEEDLYKNIKNLISDSKSDLISRLIKRLENEKETILDPIGDLDYPKSIGIPENGIVKDIKMIEKCQNIIMYALCQGLENVIKLFVEEELFKKYQTAIESQITSRMKDNIEILNKKLNEKTSYELCLENFILESYKLTTLSTLSSYASQGVILKLMSTILISIKSFLTRLFKNNGNKISVDVKSPVWKKIQAKDCLTQCDHQLLAEEVCRSLQDDFNKKHNAFIKVLTKEQKFVQKKIMISEDIRMKIAEKAPDFAGLLMLTLDVKCRYMLEGKEDKEKIGQGAQGEVYRCVCNGRELAKKVSTIHINELNEIAEEIFYSYTFMHPHLLPLVAISISDTDDIEYKIISIYSPLMKTDVLKYLKDNISPLQDRLRIGLQIAEALLYLHKQQIMHRDLKLANVLLDENDEVFLADYGFCKSEALTTYSYVGSPLHIAPEILKKEIYDHKIDIYSFGMLLWYLAEGTGKNPKYARRRSYSYSINTRPEILQNIPPKLWNLIELCWDDDPKARPDTDVVIHKLKEILSS